MNRTALTTSLIILGIAAVVAYLTLFTVYQTQQALVLEFGKPKREIKDPGLHYKIPFIQNVEYFDKRILDIDTAAQEVIASDKKRLVVDAFARYRITDPLMFFQSVRDERIANSRIGALLEASLRRVLGGASFQAVVRDKRESLMRTILSQVNQEAKEFGVEIVDVRIKRVDLPEANMQAIYRRMQTERQREAAEFRAEGEGASRRIRATADRQVTVIKADATGESERIRGDGDAERNRVYAEAFTWWVNFHHGEHWHPFVPPTPGIANGMFTIATAGETAPDVFYRGVLRVTDSEGRSSTTTADVEPELATVNVATDPSGLLAELDGRPGTAPYTVTGVVNLTRAALPVMRQQKSGHIINISSSSARFGSPGSAAYSAAKWAVSGFTASLAKEVKPFGVKAIAVEPGSIRTNWTRVARGHVPPLLPEYEPTIGAIVDAGCVALGVMVAKSGLAGRAGVSLSPSISSRMPGALTPPDCSCKPLAASPDMPASK